MAQKALKPVLEGQKIKAKKQQKDKYDVVAFRENLIPNLAALDYDGAVKFLEKGEADGQALDYRTYADPLFDILICGGTLAPGGVITPAEDGSKNPFAALEVEGDDGAQKKAADVVRVMVRRYKYLAVSLEESYDKILKYLSGFTEEHIGKLAQSTAYMLATNMISSKPLGNLTELHKLVDNGTVLTFITALFQSWLKVRTIQQAGASLIKGGLQDKLHLFFPPSKRGLDDVIGYFKGVDGLEIVAKWFVTQQTAGVKEQLTADVTKKLSEGASQTDLIDMIREVQVESKIPESHIARLLWTALINSVEWNKKQEILIEQALKHAQANTALFSRFTKSDRAQVVLMITMQEHAYHNQTFLKIFSRLCLLFYKADALGEDAIVEWYQKSHSQLGKSAFLAEMKPFIDWLATAEVEDENDKE
mmetsp:Transcript_20598/g.53550  ORF Transcript_20598/g.53550 Transcript_20598/m.53550 type:complete len:420 (-) Transcript_20598:28-1287(-)